MNRWVKSARRWLEGRTRFVTYGAPVNGMNSTTQPAPVELEAIWQRALSGIAEAEPGSASYAELSNADRMWLRLTRPLGLAGGTARLAAPNDFTKTLIEGRLSELLRAALTRELHQNVAVAVTVESL